jgi:hypothetical protein
VSDNIYHFPAQVTLLKYPLIEAWLEVHWEPQNVENGAQATDSDYLVGLASFVLNVLPEFQLAEPLPAAKLPLDVGRVIRHRFRPGPEKWPLI